MVLDIELTSEVLTQNTDVVIIIIIITMMQKQSTWKATSFYIYLSPGPKLTCKYAIWSISFALFMLATFPVLLYNYMGATVVI